MNEKPFIVQIQLALYVFLLASIIGSIRALSSIAAGLILVLGLVCYRKSLRQLFADRWKNLFLLAAAFLLGLELLSLIHTSSTKAAWEAIRIKSALLLIPLAVIFSKDVIERYRDKLLAVFCILLAGASFYCLIMALIAYQAGSGYDVFFYHTVVSPLRQHAVFYSILVFIALAFLSDQLKRNRVVFRKSFHIILICFLSVFLFLLSSKLIIVAYLVFLLSYFLSFSRKAGAGRIVVAGAMMLFLLIGTLAFTTRNPVSKRFYEIANGDLAMVRQQQFGPGISFNGLQFRMLQWRFVTSILRENHAWWKGTSSSRSQALLDQKYVSTRMYIGDPVRKDHGFLGYNTHNQFLETLLQYGVPGLAGLLLMIIALLEMAWKKKNRNYAFIIALLFAWLFSESVFETQYGLFIFSFFPFFLYENECN